MKLIRQPEDSSLCGQCCVAMAAGVKLSDAVIVVGHSKRRGTFTRELVAALKKLDVRCADRSHKMSRLRPVLPKRAIVSIRKPRPNGNGRMTYESGQWHWMLAWDGEIYDPSDGWPDSYRDWRITSYLEIYT